MKILLIDVNYKNSSTGKIVYDLMTQINQSGRDTAAVCYGRGPDTDDANVYKFGLDGETLLHAFLTRITGMTGCFSFFSTRRLLRFIDEYQPDVVHIHELHAYFVNIQPLINYLKKKHIKTIHTLHCEFSYTGKCGYADPCEKWKNQCQHCPKIREYPISLFFDHTKKMYLQKKKMFSDFQELSLTTPSQWLTARAEESFFKGKKITTVYNGVNTTVFHPCDASDIREKHGISPEEKIVLSLAPNIMEERKGGQYVLKLAEKAKDSSYRFIMIGVKGKVDDCLENVIMLPPIYDTELLVRYYSAADVFLLCSQKETFSMTCAEAICCGTPVAGFCCGAPESVFESPYARFVKYGDIDALLNAVEIQMKQKQLLDVSEYGKSHFSAEKTIQEYFKLYGIHE